MQKNKEWLDWLRIIRSTPFKPKTLELIGKLHENTEHIIEELPNIIRRSFPNKKIKIKSQQEILKEVEMTEKISGTIIIFNDKIYPPQLKEIRSPPSSITTIGKNELLSKNRTNIAVIGSRSASAHGILIAKRISEQLAEKGITVVSGLAAGIDSAAHSIIENNHPTIAVMGSGINLIYPKQNTELYNKITKQGLVLTEYQFNTAPKPSLFPQRNRIISGLSHGVLVVEATKKSGSLITVRHALEQGKEVFSVPGSPLDPRYSGSLSLLKDGAKLVDCVEDIIESLKFNTINSSNLNEISSDFFLYNKYIEGTNSKLKELQQKIIEDYNEE